MGVQLNIKDPETVNGARNLAARLGKSVTQTIREAIEEMAARLEPAPAHLDIAQLLATARSLRDHWRPEFRDQELSLTHGDLIDDDPGVAR